MLELLQNCFPDISVFADMCFFSQDVMDWQKKVILELKIIHTQKKKRLVF